jgi:Ig-like domain CHU_C associated
MKKYYTKNLLYVVIGLIFINLPSFGQVTISSGSLTYTQNFNGLSGGGSSYTGLYKDDSTSTSTNSSTKAGIKGWYATTGTIAVPTTPTQIRINDGASASSGIFSYGFITGSTTSTGVNTDRAFGCFTNSSNIPRIGVRFVNNTGKTITAVTVNYTGEQWKTGGSISNKMTFSYVTGTSLSIASSGYTNVTALDFTAPNPGITSVAIDGNSSANQQVKSFTISGLNIANGQEIMLKWSDIDDSGNDTAMAIDDFSATFVTSSLTVSPTTLNLGTTTQGTVGSEFSYTVTGANLGANNVTITPPTGVELSTTSGSGFANSLSLTPVSGSVSQVVYARIAASATGGAISGNIAHACAVISPNVNVATTGTVNLPCALVATGITGSPSVVCAGNNLSLTANSTGANGATTYAWTSSSGSFVSSTANPVLVNSIPAGTYSYTVSITDANNCTATTTTSITVNSGPSISTHPISQTVCEGVNVSFSVVATGIGLTYQWQKNNVDIPTETNASLTLNNVSISNSGNYKVIVSGTCSPPATSNVAVLTANLATVPSVSIAPVEICSGSNVTLTASPTNGGASPTFQWKKNTVDIGTGNTFSITNAIGSDIYSVVMTVSNEICSNPTTASASITVKPKPTISPNTATICSGASISLTATGCVGGILNWTGGQMGTSITVSPSISRNYKVACTLGTCTSDSSDVASITVNAALPTPTITPNSPTICAGNSVTLTASTCAGGTLNWTGGLSGTSITVSPTTNKSYRVICVLSSCASDSSLATTVVVNTKPTKPTITSTNSTVCAGSSVTLTASACLTGTLNWTGGLSGTSISVSPSISKDYKVACTISGCTSDSSEVAAIVVNQVPTKPTISPNNVSICAGSSVTLTASVCLSGTLNWTGGLSGTSITVTPTATSTYKVACTITGCTSDSSEVDSVKVNTIPTKPIITPSTSTICEGSSVTLTASACLTGTLNWTGGLSGTSITVSPSISKNYKVACTITGCTSDSSDVASITVNPKPSKPTITPNNSTICAGNTVTLTASACLTGTLNWTGGLSGTSITVSPISTKNYKVACTVNGCTSDSSDVAIITVNTIPSKPTITPISAIICIGNSATLTASVCLSGTLGWTDGLSGTSITVTPTATKSYKVACTINGCTSDSSNVAIITVNPVPSKPTISPLSATVCSGTVLTLTASACLGGTLKWTGGLTGTSITIAATVTKNYKVACVLGTCVSDSSDATTITVNQTPLKPVLTPIPTKICAGTNVILTASCEAGIDVKWYNSLFPSVSTLAFTGGTFDTGTPTITTNYWVRCESTTCVSELILAEINITPITSPSITINPAKVCEGGSLTLTNLPINGGILPTYQWKKNGINVATTRYLDITNAIAGDIYSLIMTPSAEKCTSPATATASLTVKAILAKPTITPSSVTICSGGSTTLTASTCTGGTFGWTGGLSGTSITVSPTVTKNYKVACTKDGCTSDSSDVATVTVNPIPPTPIAQANTSIPAGGNVTLTATGCTGSLGTFTLKWYKSSDNSVVIMPVSPTTATTYYAKCEQTLNSIICESQKSGDVNVSIELTGDMMSIQTGNWEDSTTWNLGRIPLATDNVIIDSNHEVTITTNAASAKNVITRTASKLIFGNTSAKLNIGL